MPTGVTGSARLARRPKSAKKAPAAEGGRVGHHLSVLRFLPLIVLPVSILGLQQGIYGKDFLDGLPLLLMSLAMACTITAVVKNRVLSVFATAMSLFLLLSASYVQELQQVAEKESSPHGRHLVLKPSSLASQAALSPAAAAWPEAAAAMLATAARSEERAPAASGASGAASGRLPDWTGSATLETLSVVLPCAFEGEYAWKTVQAIRQNTKRSRLLEIIVVDDGSKPPLEPTFPKNQLRGTSDAPVVVIRHEKTIGLIGSKKAGGDAAKGDVIVFFDCHVKPRAGWEDAFLKQMGRAGDHRTLVVPTITSLDPDTWREISGSSSKACYLLWNADFTWVSHPGRDVPLMSGGLLALSRRWWEETGGLDPHMIAWGGENIDQSLRAWLCGGRIEVAEGAYVAHMWRDQNNPKTQLKYPMPTEDVMRNKARAVMAWMGEFQNKTMSFPEYEDFLTGANPVGDMSNFDSIKSRLQCKPFSHYVSRFSYVYIDSGLIPAEVFQLREASTGRCLERAPRQHMPHGTVLAHCAGEEGGGVPELQLWHQANRDRSKPGAPCCSGLANWNFLQCLNAGSLGSHVDTFECEIQGFSSVQNFKVTDEQVEWQSGQGCLAPSETQAADAQGSIRKCGVEAEWLPESGALKLKADSTGSTCLAVDSVQEGESESLELSLQIKPCTDEDASQVFQTSPMGDGVMIKATTAGVCLDAAGGSKVLAYPCYEEVNQNQIWQLRGGSKLSWEGGTKAYCVQGTSAGLVFQEVQASHAVVFRSCAQKVGQRFKREDLEDDGSFELKDPDTGKCLTNGGAQTGALETQVKLGTCGEGQRWRSLEDRGQVQHVHTAYCLDAGDEVTPILYPCHLPKAQRKQRFKVVGDPGSVMLTSGWEDNGRKRYFEMCLDHSPEPVVQVTVDSCHTAREKGVRWSRMNSRVPVETQLWEKAEKPPPGDLGLGGGAAPPSA